MDKKFNFYVFELFKFSIQFKAENSFPRLKPVTASEDKILADVSSPPLFRIRILF